MWLQLIHKLKHTFAWLFMGLAGVQSQVVGQDESEPSAEENPINIFRFHSGNYFQEGNQSAITGGIGTERLQVFSNNFTFSKIHPGENIFTVHTGIDIISSPSTDAIDNIVSSPSLVDYRSYLSVGYEKNIGNTGLKAGLNLGMSIESDYLSFPVKISLDFIEPSQARSYKLGINMYFDDLRWGRLNFGLFSPKRLVYPAELRLTQWHDNYLRQTYDFNFTFEQVINKRSSLALLVMASIQNGLLSTPFHRVYFQNEELRVENLPSSRFKLPVGLKWNYFLGNSSIIKMDVNVFWDNFGINAQSLEFELAHYLTRTLNIKPHIKIYRQSGSDFFKPFGEHNPSDEFYTSDFDLSNFNAMSLGFAFRVFKDRVKKEKIRRNDYEFRYSYFKRTGDLSAHIITMVLTFSNQK
jgi:hypothetical protein